MKLADRGFSWERGTGDFVGLSPRTRVSALNGGRDLPRPPAYTLEPVTNARLAFPSPSPLRSNVPSAVQEY